MKQYHSKKGRFSHRSVLAIFISCLLLLTTVAPLVSAADPPVLGDVATLGAPTLSTIKAGVTTPLSDGSTVYSTDKLLLRYNFEMDEIKFETMLHNTTNGTTPYEVKIPLPAGLKWTGDTLPIDILAETPDGELKIYGQLVISPPGEASLFFSGPYLTDYEDGNYATLEDAYIEMGCALDMGEIKNKLEYALPLAEGNALNITVGDNKPTEHGVKKLGSYNAATSRFNWTVTYTPGSVPKELPFLLTDTFASGTHVFVPGSLCLNSTVLTQGDDYTVVDNGTDTTIKYEITSITPGTDMVFTYQTAPSDDALKAGAGKSNITATNAASIKDSNDQPVGSDSGEATALPDETKWLAKTGTLNADGRNIDWVVTINTNDRRLDNLTMHDLLPSGLSLNTDSIEINGGALPPANLSVPNTAEETFSIRIPKESDGTYLPEYTITYSTAVADSYFDEANTANFENAAWLTYDWLHYDGTTGVFDDFKSPSLGMPVGVDTHMVRKTGTYDRSTHEITWTVTVNPHGVYVKEGTITDDLTGKGQEYVSSSDPASFTSTSPLITLDSYTSDELIVKVGEIGMNTLTYSFITRLTDPADYAFNITEKAYYNDIAFSGKFISNKGAGTEGNVQDSVQGSVAVASRVLTKSGAGYNPSTNVVTWRVVINQNKMLMDNVTLVDEIRANQTFVPDSVKIKVGAEATEDADPRIVVLDTNPDTLLPRLNVTLGSVTDEIIVTFQTTLDVDNIAEFKNSASFTVGNSARLERDVYGPQTTSGSQTIANKILSKSGELVDNNSTIAYSVNINPNGVLMTGLSLTDQLPDGLALDIDSVNLIPASVSSTGAFSPDGAAVSPRSMEYDAANNRLSIGLPDGSGRYILEYECCITNRNLAPFNNSISFDGDVIQGDDMGDDNNVALGAGGGGGAGTSSKKARLDITVQDSEREGIKLPGVEVKLLTKMSPDDPGTVVAVGTTDADGNLSFFTLTKGREYWLEQVVDSTTGYTSPKILNGALSEHIIVPIAAGPMDDVVVITNDPSKGDVSFSVVNDHPLVYPLADVGFLLTDLTTGSTYSLTATSNADGLVTFPGVPFGNYTLEQTTLVPGHQENTTKYPVSINIAGVPSIEGLTNGTVVNFRLPASDTGTLTISNTVIGSGGDPDQLFRFSIQLLDSDDNPLTGGYNCTGAVTGQIFSGDARSLLDGQSFSIEGLPFGTKYMVVATPVADYTVTPSAELSGTITEQNSTPAADFIHTHSDGGGTQPVPYTLTISNTVTGAGSDPTDDFTFDVVLTNPNNIPLTGTYRYAGTGGTGTIVNGLGTVTLKGGQSVVIEGLPVGTKYIVTPNDNPNGYTVDFPEKSGTINETDNAVAPFVHTLAGTQPATGKLTISNEVTGAGSDVNHEFSYSVKFTDENGNTPVGSYSYSGTGGSGTISSTGIISLKGGQNVVFEELPAGTRYTVTSQPNSNGYTTTPSTKDGTVPANGDEKAHFIHTRAGTEPAFGTLIIHNTVTGSGSNSNDSFTFTVKLTDADDKPLTGAYNYSGTGGTGTITNGTGTISLKGGQDVEIKDLPAGTKYTVTAEANSKGYTVTPATNSGTILANGTTRAPFIHTRDADQPAPGTLTISNTVTGTGSNANDVFTFAVKLTNADDSALAGTYSYSGTGGTGSIVNGIGTVSLKGGQSVLIKDLPAGTKYTVTANANSNGYTTTPAANSGTIAANSNSTAPFVNTRTSTVNTDDDDPNDGKGPDNSGKGPSTGTPLASLFFFVLATLLLGGVALVAVKKRRAMR